MTAVRPRSRTPGVWSPRRRRTRKRTFTSYLRQHARPLLLAPLGFVLLVLGILYIPRLIIWIIELIVAGVTALVVQLILPTGLLIRDTLGLGIFVLLAIAMAAVAAVGLEDRIRIRP